jgi:hypothetical protein
VSSPRTGHCTPADARTRLRQAESLLLVADIALSDDTDTASPGVAAALAVLAGIAASDAACCHRLHRRPRGQDHGQAPDLVATVHPHGAEMARDLRALLAAKDDSHYGLHLVSASKAHALLKRARRLVDRAGDVVSG